MPGRQRRHPATSRSRMGASAHVFLTALSALAIGVALLAGAPTTATVVAAPQAAEPLAPSADRAPVTPDVREVELDPEANPEAESGSAEVVADSGVQEVGGFTVAGATWDAGTAEPGTGVEVRTRTGSGSWSPWQQVELHEEHGPDPGTAEAAGARDGSDPIVLGAVDQVEARVTSPGGAVPQDLELALIDTEPVSADAPVEQAEITGVATGAVATAGLQDDLGAGEVDLESTSSSPRTTRPRMFSRAQWGADERLRDGSPHYYEVHAGFVHHTVNANGYTKSQVPGIIRGVYAYHTQSRGWSDIGYNFLVDRFGRIWEGRYGGVARPVVGAHTLGYNDYSFAMSAIGNFETAYPSKAMVDAYGRLMAWKLSLHGVYPKSRRWVGGTRFKAISGHRDAGSTACPGRHLYARLGTIRNKADDYQRSYTGRGVKHNLLGTRAPDLLVKNDSNNTLRVMQGTYSASYGKALYTGQTLTRANAVISAGDLTSDGRVDVLVRTTTGNLWLFEGNAAGRLTRSGIVRRNWEGMRHILGVGDMSGDGIPDLMAQDRDYHMWTYPGNGNGGFKRRYGARSNMIRSNAAVPAGKWNNDGSPDVIVRSAASGDLYLYPGNGPGGLTAARRIGNASGYDRLAGLGDVNADRNPDILARKRGTAGLWLLPGTDSGSIGTPVRVRGRMAKYDLIS